MKALVDNPRGVVRCRACDTAIMWTLSPSGKRTPVTITGEGEAGNVLLLKTAYLDSPLAVVLSGEALERARAQGAQLMLNHFANCPEAAQFRRGR